MLPPDPSGGEPERVPYEIWEYGQKDGVEVLETAGTLDQVTTAMQSAHCDHFVVVNLFSGDDAEKLRGFNRWAVEVAAGRSDMTAFVAADPLVLGGRAGAAHLADMHERGARGIKIHPIVQAFMPDDPRMDAIYATCEDLGLGVIAHTGASKDGPEWAQPRAYVPVLAAHPYLKLVLAHLGGARWRQVVDLAGAFANVSFDLCEIIAWTGAPGAPSRDQLGRMIKEIGPGRVLFGTDFPWYDVEATVNQVMDLPHLGVEEKEAILGANAIRTLGLDVAL